MLQLLHRNFKKLYLSTSALAKIAGGGECVLSRRIDIGWEFRRCWSC